MNAVKMALLYPLLDNNSIEGTKNILLNIISGTEEITIGEIGEIIEYLQREAGQEADIIWGNGYDDSLGENISVTILCTGFKNAPTVQHYKERALEAELKNRVEEEKEREKDAGHGAESYFVELEIDSASEEKPVYQPAPSPPQEKKQPPVRQTRTKPAKQPDGGNDSLDNWFYRKFGKLFEDDDQSV